MINNTAVPNNPGLITLQLMADSSKTVILRTLLDSGKAVASSLMRWRGADGCLLNLFAGAVVDLGGCCAGDLVDKMKR